jgi:hypothetical protein
MTGQEGVSVNWAVDTRDVVAGGEFQTCISISNSGFLIADVLAGVHIIQQCSRI